MDSHFIPSPVFPFTFIPCLMPNSVEQDRSSDIALYLFFFLLTLVFPFRFYPPKKIPKEATAVATTTKVSLICKDSVSQTPRARTILHI